jgi:hypothetical protein
MTRKYLLCTIVLVALIFLLATCTNGNDKGLSYYVSFNADGNPVTLTWGDIPYLIDEYDFAYGGIYSPKQIIHVEASEEGNNNHYIRFYFPGTTTGTYSGNTVDVEYTTDYANNIQYSIQNFTVTVDKIENVNGIMTGTFSGIFNNSNLGSLNITNGSFRVKRVE